MPMSPECLVCGKSNEQVIKKTVDDYLHLTAELRKSVRDKVSKRNVLLAGLESGIFTFVSQNYRRVSPVTAKVTW